jgi:hypothetical protein
MQLCDKHYADIKDAMTLRGLWKLRPQTDEELKQKMKDANLNGENATNFDPLRGVTIGIYSNALQQGGEYLLHMKDDGSHHCPLCEVLIHKGQDHVDDWVNAASDEAMRRSIEYGLMPSETAQ